MFDSIDPYALTPSHEAQETLGTVIALDIQRRHVLFPSAFTRQAKRDGSEGYKGPLEMLGSGCVAHKCRTDFPAWSLALCPPCHRPRSVLRRGLALST
ncbi:hypothetical protein BD310DRAFT_724199 [Dichomitus squalens]|uniref:Uncharacterized protein n=1 Tax=Dichomitus squalens TaxID=114155 RepID=A0A4Q9PLD5_9APHY|nr:hypothetical protein BD310DRAFT_724199 [Dichomitus squalens]